MHVVALCVSIVHESEKCHFIYQIKTLPPPHCQSEALGRLWEP